MASRHALSRFHRGRSARDTVLLASLAVVVSGLPALLRLGPDEITAALPFIVAALIMTQLGASHARLVACITVLTVCLPVLFGGTNHRPEAIRNAIFVSLAIGALAWTHQRQSNQLRKRARVRRRMVGRVRRHAKRLEKTGTALRQHLEQTQVAQQTLLEHLPVHVIQKDREGRFTFVSQSFAKLLGRTTDEVLGKTDYDFYDKSIADKFRQDDQKVVDDGTIVDDVERTQLPDGKFGYMQVRKAPLRNAAGEIVGVQGIFWDVTEEFSGRVQLQRIESRAHALIQAALDAVLIIDANGRVLEANPASSTILGYTQESESEHPPLGEIMRAALSDSELREPYDRPLGQRVVAKELEESDANGSLGWLTQLLKQATGRRIEVRLRRCDDTWFDAEISAHPMAVEHSSGWAIFIRDITRRKRSIAELQVAKESAERANAAKSEFVANVSHELRTPLTGIVGLHELLERSELNDQQREYLTLAQKSGGNLLALIDALLDFSKIEAQRLELQNAPFHLVECVENAASALAARAQLRGLELVVDVAPDLPRLLVGDADRVRQILLNLIGNAIKFTHRGNIVVRVSRCSGKRTASSREILFEVIDSGIGIAQEHLAVIFEPFRQADNSSTRRYGGTGLGLAICHELVNQMGGSIEVQSSPEKGSTFSFYLPDEEEFDSNGPAASDAHSLPVLRSSAISSSNIWTQAIVAAQDSLWCDVLERDLQARGLQVVRITIEDVVMRRPANCFSAGNQSILFMDHSEMNSAAPSSLPVCARTVLCLPLASPRPTQPPEWARHSEIKWLARPIAQAELDRVLNPLGSADWAAPVTVESDSGGHVQIANILLVEDSPINQAVLRGMLHQLGHRVTLARSGAEAIAKSKQEFHDVILMDIQMPEVDGLEATRRIRECERESGQRSMIIALTAHAMPSDRELCIQVGMDDFLVKPIPLEKLRNAIDSALTRALSFGKQNFSTDKLENPQAATAHSSDPQTDSSDAGLPVNLSNPDPNESTEDWPTFEMVQERLGGSEALVIDVLGLVRSEVPRLWREFVQSTETRNSKAARRAAHTLKSNFRNVALNRCSSIAGELETWAQKEQWSLMEKQIVDSDKLIAQIPGWAEALISRS